MRCGVRKFRGLSLVDKSWLKGRHRSQLLIEMYIFHVSGPGRTPYTHYLTHPPHRQSRAKCFEVFPKPMPMELMEMQAIDPLQYPSSIRGCSPYNCNLNVATSNARNSMSMLILFFPDISNVSRSSSRAFVLYTFLTGSVVSMVPRLLPPKLS